MVRLRGHHLICLHFYRGEGYSEEFVENLAGALKAAAEGGVTVVEGGDDVCRACPSYNGASCTHQPGGEQKIQALDELARKLLKIDSGPLDWDEINRRIPLILGEWKQHACGECEWIRVCEKDEKWKTAL